MAIKFPCQCGYELELPNGFFPESFLCPNCGTKFHVGENLNVNFPNLDLKGPKGLTVNEVFNNGVQ